MSTDNITPTSIAGIKRLAKAIAQANSVSHAVGLDRASVRAGYANYINARRILNSSAAAKTPLHVTYIKVRWRNPESRENGTEIVEVALPRPLDEIVEARCFKHARGLWNFSRAASDLIECKTSPRSEGGAVSVACAAARTLQFMAATGLRPSKGADLPGGGGPGRLPGRDHSSSWFDPATRRTLVLDEPYAAAVTNRQQERDAWANRNDWRIVKSAWGGIYFPDGGSELYLLSDRERGIALEPVEIVLSSLDEAVVPDNCSRINLTAKPFVTPGEVQMKVEKTAKALTRKIPKQPHKPSNAVPYKMFLTSGRRPKAAMSVEKHSEVGKLLKAVLVATEGRAGVSKRVDHVRSELDNWVQMEYDRASLPDSVFFDLYYHEQLDVPEAERGLSGRARQVERLQDAKAILIGAYPESKPLQDVVRKLDLAIKSLDAWR